MSMKIPSLGGIAPTQSVGRTENDHPAPEKTPPPRTAAVELAAIVAESAEHASEVTEKAVAERAQLLVDIRKRLSSGEYQIDFDKLTDKILDDETARKSPRR